MARRTRIVKFQVSFTLPYGATIARAEEYVSEAVTSACGGLKPPGADDEDPEGDPMFDLNRDTVKVRRILKDRT